MLKLRHLLLVLALFFAQLASSAHALEHVRDSAHHTSHACSFCLAAQDLGAALPTLHLPPSVSRAALAPEQAVPAGRNASRPLRARQRAPPSA